MGTVVKLAAVQATPVFLDRDATVAKAVDLIAEAGAAGAEVIAFPETWIPGYPIWIFGSRPILEQQVFARLQANSIEVPSPAVDRLAEAARAAGAFVVMGAHERDAAYSHGTLYNSQLFFSPEGELLGVRRKLMPTDAERTLWGRGDGSDLQVYDTAVGRLGASICWEHWMPLGRFAMHASGEQVHVAAWPGLPGHVEHLASQHYAFEGRCYVLSVGSYLRLSDIPDDFRLKNFLNADLPVDPDLELLTGGSGIIAPDGTWCAGPVSGREEILYADADLAAIGRGQQMFDAAGHYNRPDIFHLSVDRRARPQLTWLDDGSDQRPGDQRTPEADSLR